jgi:hypothetical protein
MIDLREQLDLESRRVSLAPGAEERMFERQERRDRLRRAATVTFALALVAGVIAVVAAVRRLGLKGTYHLQLGSDGSLLILAPRNVGLPGSPATFSLTDSRFVTDLLVGDGCDGKGTYRWSLEGGRLTLTPIVDRCELRTTVLATQPWTSSPQPAADELQGDWLSTFTCEAMVETVEAADVNSQLEKFWRRAYAIQLGSADESDPCAGNPPPLTYHIRFANGRLQVFDPPDDAEGFDGGYELHGDRMTIRDATTNNIVGTYEVAYQLDGDRLTFDILGRGGRDPFTIAVWETAEFRRA